MSWAIFGTDVQPMARWQTLIPSGRQFRRALVIIAVIGLASGLAALSLEHVALAHRLWIAGTIPVLAAFAVSIALYFLARG